MSEKRVRTVDEIVFDRAEPPVILQKGSVYGVEAVTDSGVILYTDDNQRFMIDLVTFENGFEAVG